MRSIQRLLPAVFFLFFFAVPAAHADLLPLAEWEPEEGDMFIVDTAINVGYLRHRNGDYAVTYLASGQKRPVRWLGMWYYAATPDGWWVVKSTHTQSDRRTFGPTGYFMRLYHNGKDYTKYGIHSTSNIDELLTQPERFFSMGCILVNDYVLSLLNQTYLVNGEQLQVVTRRGIEKELYLDI